MKLVLDTNIVVAGLRSPQGASAHILRDVIKDKVTALISVPLIFEYEATCLRPEHLLATGLDQETILNVLDVLAGACKPVVIDFSWRPQLRDPADEMVLEAAVNGQADAIITHNMRDFSAVPGRFELDVMTPGQFLERRKGQ